MSLFHAGLQPALDANGRPISGARWYFYETETTTPVSVYADDDLTVSLGSNVAATSDGRFPPIYFDDSKIIRAVLRDQFGSEIPRGDVDPVNADIFRIPQNGVADRSAMTALDPTVNKAVALLEEGREGLFLLKEGSPPSDPLEGIYVTSSTPGYYWQRDWDKTWVDPRWFGAVVGDSNTDNRAPIQACLDLGYNVRLAAGKWYVGDGGVDTGEFALEYKFNGQVIEGIAASKDFYLTGAGAGTEIIILSSALSGVLMGSKSAPSGSAPGSWREGCVLRNLSIRRAVNSYQLNNPVSGNTNAPVGVLLKYAAVCTLENVYCFEHSIGVWIAATVACKLTNCRVERYKAGAAPGNDFSIGFYQDNSLSTPYNSGNASLYYLGCGFFSNEASNIGGETGDYTYAAGIQSYQGFTDTFVRDFEGANCGYGVDFNGRTSTGSGDYHTEDLSIIGCVFDGCRWDGIRIQTGASKTAVQIIGNYCGVTNATGPLSNGIHIDECHGSIQIANNQILGTSGNPARGLYVRNSSGVVARGNIYTDLSIPAYFDGAVLCRIQDQINVSAVAPASAGVELVNCQYAKIDCEIANSTGVANIATGVKLTGALNSKIEVNVTNVHNPSISGNKLTANGVTISAAGAFNAGAGANTGLASGIF